MQTTTRASAAAAAKQQLQEKEMLDLTFVKRKGAKLTFSQSSVWDETFSFLITGSI